MQNCPCGTAETLLQCCGKFISQQEAASTPEELMRSRYTAYTQKNMQYIVATMLPPALDRFEREKRAEETQDIEWLKLEVLNSSQTGARGTVEFKAYYLLQHKKNVLHECSEFVLQDGRWFYTDGKHSVEKVGRNDLCLCGSGKKYKKCCA